MTDTKHSADLPPLPAPLEVFDKGPWRWAETGENFTGQEMDAAAYAKYADAMRDYGDACARAAIAAAADGTNLKGLQPGWKERLYAAMEAHFDLYENGPRDADGQRQGMRIDDTQIGVEFAMRWIEEFVAAPAGEPVAYADPQAFLNFEAARKEGDRRIRGREWMWASPDVGLVPIYAAPVPAAAPKAALTPEQIIETANYYLGSYDGGRYESMDTFHYAHTPDGVLAFAKAIEAASGPNAALVAIIKKYWKGDYFAAVSRSDVEGIEAALAAAGVK